ncbi:Farnesyl diphosphate synthase [Candidatus Hartigia pinicola]|nr:Farnesyl diphosphate synthase [Candidatus Hartigia pinicola]
MPKQQHDHFITQQKHACERVNQCILNTLNALPFSDLPLSAAMRYSTLLGGKRLRPFLTYTVGKMLGVNLENLDSAAAAIECIHAYSLIHDDLPAMDNDNLRRGKPTCHIKFGESNAILAGDALQTLAFQLLASGTMPDVTYKDRISMLSELASASGLSGMCGGQALDLDSEGKDINLESLKQIHQHKTGALIRAAIRIGAYAAGKKGYTILPLLDKYANSIGLAFQVRNDILDVIGDSALTGKQQGTDIKHKKNTYPALLGLKSSQKKANDLYYDSLDALKTIETQGYNTKTLANLANFIIQRKN